jgi:hypothetical protein
MKITKQVTIRLNHDDMTKAVMDYVEKQVEAKILFIQIDVNLPPNFSSGDSIKEFSAIINVDGDANFKGVTLENSSAL